MIDCLAVSPDGHALASADETGSLRLWGLRTGREFYELFKHDHQFRQLNFSADGRELVGFDNEFERLVDYRWSCESGVSTKN